MQGNIVISIASTLLDAAITFLYHHNIRKNIRMKSYSILGCLLWEALISTILNMMTIILEKDASDIPAFVITLVNVLFFIFNNMLMPTFVIYCFSLTERYDKTSVIAKILLYAVLAAEVYVILSTPFLNTVFYIDDNKHYHRNPGVNVLYFGAVFLLIYGLIHIIKNREFIDKKSRWALYVFSTLPYIGVIIQGLFPQMMCESFGVALGLMCMYLNIQKPEDIIEPITGNLNERFLFYNLSRDLRNDRHFYIIALHVEQIEFYRGLYGTYMIQSLLRKIGIILQDKMKNFGSVYYIGNNKYVGIIKNRSEDDIREMVDNAKKRLEIPYEDESVIVHLHTNVVILDCPKDATSLAEIMDYIDCLGKKHSLDEKKVYDAKDLDISERKRKIELERAIIEALEKGYFEVYYQPIYSLKNKKVKSAEALLRLKHPKLGFVSPEEFIPIAEANGKIIEIDNFVLEEVCKYLNEKEVQALGIEYIEINLSVVECVQLGLADKILSTLEKYHITADKINFEITGTASSMDMKRMDINISEMKKRGIQFSLDDYGTGYSNSTYILEQNFEIIKIDKSLLWMALKNEKAMTLLRRTIGMLRELNAKVLVEGVETEEMVTLLDELQCDFLQGYYYSKPVDRHEFIMRIREINEGERII